MKIGQPAYRLPELYSVDSDCNLESAAFYISGM